MIISNQLKQIELSLSLSIESCAGFENFTRFPPLRAVGPSCDHISASIKHKSRVKTWQNIYKIICDSLSGSWPRSKVKVQGEDAAKRHKKH